MLELLQIWLVVEVLGLVCFPLTFVVFHNLPDRGWAFSKTLGLVVFTFCVWCPLMWLPFLPFTRLALVAVALILLVLSLLLFLRMRQPIQEMVQLNIPYVLFTEILFLGMVFLLGWVRSFGPEINGWEMFMDEGFLTSIMRSPHLPPADMWYAGQSINYYYYAHFTIAVLAKLIGQPAYIAFNTGICILFGLTGINFFGVTCNIVTWSRVLRTRDQQSRTDSVTTTIYPSLTGSSFFGLLTILMALLMGNLAATQQWWQAHGMVTATFSSAYNFWVGPTRVINNTINEFPAFSFLLSCFHAHVLGFAFTILAIGCAFNLFLEADGQGLYVFGKRWQLPATLLCTSLVVGGLFTMNGWDYPTYMGFCLVCILIQQWITSGMRFTRKLILNSFSACAVLASLSFLLYLPFFLHFVSPAQGIGLVSPANRTPLRDEILIYGIFAFVFLSFLIASAVRQPFAASSRMTSGEVFPSIFVSHGRKMSVGIIVVLFLALVIMVVIPNSSTFVVVACLALIAFFLAFYHLGDRALAFPLLLGALAFLLLAGCEVFFLRDVFPNEPRMNTVFKFYFQAWALLSIASSVGLFFLIEALRPVKGRPTLLYWGKIAGSVGWYSVLGLFLLAGMVYPLLAPYARYGPGDYPVQRTRLSSSGSLDGLAYLQDDPIYPGDYAAIRWLNMHVQGNPVLIEAVGSEYSNYGRISVFTGLSSLINWPGHEYQWRVTWLADPKNAEDYLQRQIAVDVIYEAADKNVVLATMARYHAEYVYVGAMEYQKYPKVNLQRFATFMHVIYNAQGVTIYKVP